MVVAVITVRVVQVAVDEIVDMVAVRNGFVPAARTVYMIRIMAAALVIGGAAVWVGFCHRDDMLVNVIAMHVMQMAVVQIIDVAIMQDRQMAAVGAVLMGVVGRVRKRAACHGRFPFPCGLAGQGALASVSEVRLMAMLEDALDAGKEPQPSALSTHDWCTARANGRSKSRSGRPPKPAM